MKQRTKVVMLATLVAATAQAQEVSVYGTSMAQVWREDLPGFNKNTVMPATQYLGIDATKLGSERLSLHLFGWGNAQLGDVPQDYSRTSSDLTYGYLEYRFNQANADVKLGRFAINSGAGLEQVDGVTARADLRGGFTISAFAGKPVLYRLQNATLQNDYEAQRKLIFGTRLGLRMSRVAEVGVSFLQDGTAPAKDGLNPPVDFTRKQVTGDVRIRPNAVIDFTGHTTYELEDHNQPVGADKASRLAEHDYTLSLKLGKLVSVAGNYVERNYQAYFAGSTMPSLFRTDEKDGHKTYGASVIFNGGGTLEVIPDYRHTHRDSYGDSNRFGADVRWAFAKNFKSGFSFHKVNADTVAFTTGPIPSYALAYRELRAWAMYEGAVMCVSVDGIQHHFDDKNNPNLNGIDTAYELIGSLGVKLSPNFKISGDVGVSQDAIYKREGRAALRLDWRFGLGSKGGSK